VGRGGEAVGAAEVEGDEGGEGVVNVDAEGVREA